MPIKNFSKEKEEEESKRVEKSYLSIIYASLSKPNIITVLDLIKYNTRSKDTSTLLETKEINVFQIS